VFIGTLVSGPAVAPSAEQLRLEALTRIVWLAGLLVSPGIYAAKVILWGVAVWFVGRNIRRPVSLADALLCSGSAEVLRGVAYTAATWVNSVRPADEKSVWLLMVIPSGEVLSALQTAILSPAHLAWGLGLLVSLAWFKILSLRNSVLLVLACVALRAAGWSFWALMVLKQ
jgi:hypothetical protein